MPEADDNKVVPKVRKPPTETERKSARLAAVAKESDDERSKRRSDEFQALFDVHMQNIALSHAKYPVRNVKFDKLTAEEQKLWNERRIDIDMHNRLYHNAVKQTYASHVEEDQHINKLRAAAAKSVTA